MAAMCQPPTGPFSYRPVGLRLGLMLGLVGAAFAFGFPGGVRGGKPQGTSLDRDGKLTMLARQVLQGDERLARYNLGVIVQDRVAILWGPVPAGPLARRAEDLLRNLPDLLEVRNELHLDPSQDVGSEQSLRPAPREQSFRKAKPTGPAGLTGFPREADRSARLSAALVGKSGPDNPGSGRAELKPGDKHTVVLPAITIPVGPEGGKPTSGQAGHKKPAATPPAPGMEVALRHLRQRYPQFRSITTEVRGGFVYVGGTASQAQEVLQFAQAIAELPGVEQVIVQKPRAQR